MIEDVALTRKNFSRLVENAVQDKRIKYIDAVLEICKERGIDPSDVNSLLTNIVKQKIEAEAIGDRKIKGRNNTLPI